MIYTDSGKYAIRALTYLAIQPEEELPVAAAEIARAEGIPPYYLAKVLQDLARADLLTSVRGRGGGFKLKRPAEKITVMEILEAVENIRRITKECVLGLDECNDATPCPMHDSWKQFRETFLEGLGRNTLAMLAAEIRRKRAAAARTP